MTWLRWDTEAAFSDVVDDLAAELKLPVAYAFGLYVACCLGFGQHRRDGVVAAVKDSALEDWARWKGKAGKFAVAFRQRCTSDGSGRDPSGVVRGWWRNEAVIRKQEIDSRRPDGRKRIPQESPVTPERDRRGISGGNETTTTSPSGTTIRNGSDVVVPATAAREITAALNRGMTDNPRIAGRFNPVIASAGAQVVTDWLHDGIPWQFAAETVYGIATAFKGEGQVSSLLYCDRAVRKTWARKQASTDAVSAPANPPSSLLPVL